MPLLANALISTGRGGYNATTGVTNEDTTPYLSNVPIHIEVDRESTFVIAAQSAGALETHYHGWVDSGTDVAAGDMLLSVTLLDGTTPWPADGPAPNTANARWNVTYHEEESGMLLPKRYLHITRLRGGGTAHS